jgi:menaquinol-cytochrome c reductase iron-sulfur subunit
MAFALPALGFALGPVFEDTNPTVWQDVGPEGDFNDETYAPRVISIDPEIGDAGKSTVYVRKFNPSQDKVIKGQDPQPYVVISTRCAHLGCPVRYIQASAKFLCPCHGGIYGFQGQVEGGPPVRPLDRFYTRVTAGRVEVGDRFSLNSELERFSPRDPSNHLDGLWQYLYPSRPTT